MPDGSIVATNHELAFGDGAAISKAADDKRKRIKTNSWNALAAASQVLKLLMILLFRSILLIVLIVIQWY